MPLTSEPSASLTDSQERMSVPMPLRGLSNSGIIEFPLMTSAPKAAFSKAEVSSRWNPYF